jgi:beta-glucosidase
MQSSASSKYVFVLLSIAVLVGLLVPSAIPQSAQPAPSFPWMNKALSPDQRADLVLQQMTVDEKIQLVHGTGWGVLRGGAPVPPRSNLGAGFVQGIDRLGIPDINLADSAAGIRMAALQSRYATLLPSPLGLAATWDLRAALLYGSVIGRELRDQGFNMSIGGTPVKTPSLPVALLEASRRACSPSRSWAISSTTPSTTRKPAARLSTL